MTGPRGTDKPYPFVSVVVPCRNEASHLDRGLAALLAQDYPSDRMEIVVVDGLSEDGSADMARRILAQGRSAFSVLSNPERITPTAWNLGIQHARGEVIVVVIAHAELAPDYVRQAVAILGETGADCVGGAIRTQGDPSALGAGIALALSSAFGVGGSTFRTRVDHSGFVDTVPFGAYRRDVFERWGLLDPAFVRNQDTEINFRITEAGGRIWMDRRLRSVYHSRGTLGRLWRQHFHTGASKVQLFGKYGRLPAWRHYVPGAFVATAVVSVAAAALLREPVVALAVVGPYLAAVLTVSAWVARKSIKLWPFVTIAMPTLHLSYGLGFLAGIWNHLRRRRSQRPWEPDRLPSPRTTRS